MEVPGIDVSSHQGVIDWSKVQTDFVILRAGWSWYQGGMNIDQRFLENVAGVQAAGIPWGVYLYAYDRTPAAARIAAARLSDLLSDYELAYPVYYDIEDDQYTKMSREDNTAIALAFLEAMKERGHYTGLYTYTSFANSFLVMEKLASYDLWIADYRGKMGYTGPGDVWMWQHTGTGGRTQGISGDVDQNLCYKDYPSIIQPTIPPVGQNPPAGIPDGWVPQVVVDKLQADYTALEARYNSTIESIKKIIQEAQGLGLT